MIMDKIKGNAAKWLFTALVAASALVTEAPSATAGSSHRRGHSLSIGAARALPIGSRVAVEGIVSTPSGAFASSFFDAGFGLQDHAAGIYVSVQTDPDLDPGARVRVSGVLADSFGLLVLLPDAPSAVEVRGHAHAPRPLPVRTGDVSEATEGLLVRVKATVTQAPSSDLPYGYKFFVDDGSGELQIFVNVETGIDLEALEVGRAVKVVGMSSQFEDHYEIDPRFPADVTLVRSPRWDDDCDEDE